MLNEFNTDDIFSNNKRIDTTVTIDSFIRNFERRLILNSRNLRIANFQDDLKG